MRDDDDIKETPTPSRGITAPPTDRCEHCGAQNWIPLDETHYVCGRCKKRVIDVNGRRV